MNVIYRLGRRFFSSPGQEVKPQKLHGRPITIHCQKTAAGVQGELERLASERRELKEANAAYFVPNQSLQVVSWPEGWTHGKEKDYTELPVMSWRVRFYRI